jgi:SAM-dependent methyltransferase
MHEPSRSTSDQSLFPSLYHAHHGLHAQDIPFWLEISGRYPAPVLELGCGTGRVLIPLALQGKWIVGLDNDFDMLHLLKENLLKFPLAQAHILQADFTAFHLSAQFGLVLLTCNTYSTLTMDERQALLRCVFDHLSPGGVFVASMPNPFLLKHLPRRAEPEVEAAFPHPEDGEPVQVSSGWVRNRDRFTVHWHYDHLFPDGKVERLSTQVTHYLTPVEQYCQESESAGFSSLTCLGDYDGSEFSPTAPQLILLASR